MKFFLILALALQAGSSLLLADDVCARLRESWGKVQSYQCSYRAVTRYGGKKSESLMRYSYQKPDQVRMDIEVPRKGAIVIYNAAVSDKVRVRPFRGLSSLVMTYPLNHKRVTTDSGRTIRDSHLGERVDQLCECLSKGSGVEIHSDQPTKEIVERLTEGGKKYTRRYFVGEDWMIRKIETTDERGAVTNLLEWNDLIVNPDLRKNLFTELK